MTAVEAHGWMALAVSLVFWVLAPLGVWLLTRLPHRDSYGEDLRWGFAAYNSLDYATGARRFASAVKHARQAYPFVSREALITALLQHAQALREMGRIRDAAGVVEEALRVRSSALRAELHLVGAGLWSMLGDAARAEEMLRPITTDPSVEPVLQARAALNTGMVRLNNRAARSAIPAFQQALAGFEALQAGKDIREERASTLAMLALAAFRTGLDQEAQAAARRALQAWAELEDAWDGLSSPFFLHYQFGQLYEVLEDPTAALDHWVKAVPPFPRPLLGRIQAASAARLANALRKLGRIREADHEASRLLDYCEQRNEGEVRTFAVALQQKALAAQTMGLYDEAGRLFQAGIEKGLQRAIPDHESAAVVCISLAQMRMRQAQRSEAISCLDRARDFLANLTEPDPEVAASALNSRGVVLLQSGLADEAITCWREADALWRHAPRPEDFAAVHLDLHTMAQDAGPSDEDAAYGRVRVKVEAMRDSNSGLPWILAEMALALALQGRREEALPLWNRGRALAFQQAGDIDVQPAEYLEWWSDRFDHAGWREFTGEMRKTASSHRAEVATAVDAAFPGRRAT